MSCLFNSLSYFVGKDSYEIRQMICNYLEENKPIIEGLETHEVIKFENVNVENYIRNMRSPSTWGGAIELQCACNIWNYKINVLNYRDRNNTTIEFLPLNGNMVRTINVYWTGNHYEPIKEKKEKMRHIFLFYFFYFKLVSHFFKTNIIMYLVFFYILYLVFFIFCIQCNIC